MKKYMYSFLFLSMFAAMPLVGMEDDGSGSDYEFGDEIALASGGIGVFKSKKRPKNTEGYTKVRGLGWVKIKKEEPKSHAGGDSDRAVLEKRIKGLERRLYGNEFAMRTLSDNVLARINAIFMIMQVSWLMPESEEDVDSALIINASDAIKKLIVNENVVSDFPAIIGSLLEAGGAKSYDDPDEAYLFYPAVLSSINTLVTQFGRKLLKRWHKNKDIDEFVENFVCWFRLEGVKIDLNRLIYVNSGAIKLLEELKSY